MWDYLNDMNRNEIGINVLVCSRGGGGLLFERMELVAELWEENIRVGNLILCKIVWYFCCTYNSYWKQVLQAEFVPLRDPSLTEQYEYASDHDIKCLVVITDSGVSQKGSVQVGLWSICTGMSSLQWYL